MNELFENEIISVAAVLICLIIASLGIISPIDRVECAQKAEFLGYSYEWGIFKGCGFIRPDGTKVLREYLRDVNE